MTDEQGNGAANHPTSDALAPSEPILVELSTGPGRQQVTLKPEEVAAKSVLVLDRSMDTIRAMAERVTRTMDSVEGVRPDEVQVTFGIKFDAQAGAILTKVGVEASIQVQLTWKPKP
jgi:hypothetical protein